VVLGRVAEPGFLAHVDAMGHLLRHRLGEIDGAGIVEVRGLGLMLGVELDRAVQPLVDRARDRGLLVLSAGPKVLRLLPPLNVLADEVDRAVEVLAEVLRKGSGSC
jgi:acetylornithine/succinyldiaminopimelate/putrescine aminotransferase